MTKIRLAILCPSEIAFRRFMPALKKVEDIEYIGIAAANEEEWFGKTSPNNDLNILKIEYDKALKFKESYGGEIFDSYESLLKSDKIDAVYIPLPPALHFKWAKLALENGKHVFVEKPSTTQLTDTTELVDIAKENKLALHENYMFNFHSQIEFIENEIRKESFGSTRLIRIAFGFPFRGKNDFRYNKNLGGGALLDCGGYTLKLATRLLGSSARLVTHQLNYVDNFDVDIYGSGTLVNDEGTICQVSFGMDNSYKCELEIWGSKGTIYTNRILTAPDNFEPLVTITLGNETNKVKLPADDSFRKSIEHFIKCIYDDKIRDENYKNLVIQSKLVDEFKEDI